MKNRALFETALNFKTEVLLKLLKLDLKTWMLALFRKDCSCMQRCLVWHASRFEKNLQSFVFRLKKWLQSYAFKINYSLKKKLFRGLINLCFMKKIWLQIIVLRILVWEEVNLLIRFWVFRLKFLTFWERIEKKWEWEVDAYIGKNDLFK